MILNHVYDSILIHVNVPAVCFFQCECWPAFETTWVTWLLHESFPWSHWKFACIPIFNWVTEPFFLYFFFLELQRWEASAAAARCLQIYFYTEGSEYDSCTWLWAEPKLNEVNAHMRCYRLSSSSFCCTTASARCNAVVLIESRELCSKSYLLTPTIWNSE